MRKNMSGRWLNEHFRDQFVKRAHAEKYRARSAYKLLDIQKKDRLIRPGMIIIDLGAAPGAWSQVAVGLLKGHGQVIALDKLPIKPLSFVQIIQGDLLDVSTQNTLYDSMAGKKADLVLSDIAPSTSGIKILDQARSMELAMLAFNMARRLLKTGGNFLVKVFQGDDLLTYKQLLNQHFETVLVRKPESSRSRSVEIYLLAKGLKR
jgi:23S rRNA (uridine2552-2'-O)-methyltransferase